MPTPTYAGGPRSGSSCGIVKVSTVSQMVALQEDKSTRVHVQTVQYPLFAHIAHFHFD